MRNSFKDTEEEIIRLSNEIFVQIGRNVTKEDGTTFRAIYDSLYSSSVGTRFDMNVPKNLISEIKPGTRLKLERELVSVRGMMENFSYGILNCEIISDN